MTFIQLTVHVIKAKMLPNSHFKQSWGQSDEEILLLLEIIHFLFLKFIKKFKII